MPRNTNGEKSEKHPSGIAFRTWRARLERAAERARKKPPKKTAAERHPNSIANLRRGGMPKPPPEHRRCQAKSWKSGQRCKAYAMHGAPYCNKHKGHRWVPEHPGNIRRELSGENAREHLERTTAGYNARTFKRSEIAEAREMINEHGARARPTRVKTVIELWDRPDGGAALRRYIASLPPDHPTRGYEKRHGRKYEAPQE